MINTIAFHFSPAAIELARAAGCIILVLLGAALGSGSGTDRLERQRLADQAKDRANMPWIQW